MSPIYQRKDYYYKKAKEQGFASRATFKLEEIDSQFHLLQKGFRILDLGCAPGGWLQYEAKRVGPTGKVVGIDLLRVKTQFPGQVILLQGDANDQKIQEEAIRSLGGEADGVLSDLSPNLTGVHFQDCYRSYELCCMVLKVAKKVLKKGGVFVVKIFPGEDAKQYQDELRQNFQEVRTFVPHATRRGSSEVYLIGKGFKGMR